MILEPKLPSKCEGIAVSWGHTEACWRGCIGFASLLASFGNHFGSIRIWLLTLFHKFWHRFRYFSALLSKSLDVCLHCFSYHLRSRANPKTLWPRAWQISGMSQSINQSMNPRIRSHVLFFRRPGVPPGRPTTRLHRGNTTLQHRLKIAPFFIQFFLKFESIRGAKLRLKSAKIITNALQNRTWFSYRFRYHFSLFCFWCSLPPNTKNQAKTMECYHCLYFSDFRATLWNWFWMISVSILTRIFEHFRTFSDKERTQKLILKSCCFFTFSTIFGSKLAVGPR